MDDSPGSQNGGEGLPDAQERSEVDPAVAATSESEEPSSASAEASHPEDYTNTGREQGESVTALITSEENDGSNNQPPSSAPQTESSAVGQIKKYDRRQMQAPLQSQELARSHYAVHHIFGFDVARRSNLVFVEENVVAYIAGNALVLLDLTTLRRRYVFGIDGRGMGSLAVHPSRRFIAVGEKGNGPNIYLYSYPDLEIIKVLRKGADRSIGALSFNAESDTLASLSAVPDYMLTVWDWEQEAITLHTKAFGQDVFSVAFSPDNPGRLVTSGTGHIRFWKMASTFTGLKLQGDIGKFGKVELSDIDSFALLPDGKVLSSTEAGVLLLWEGNFIKLRLVRRGGQPCHEGAVYVVALERQEGRFVTAGQDGWLRWWDFSTIDAAEIDSDNSMDYEIEPVDEVQIGEGRVIIRHLTRWLDAIDASKDRYLLQDMSGAIWIYHGDSRKSNRILDVPGGALSGMGVSPTTHFAATASVDGTVRCWDYVARKQLFHSRFDIPVTSLRWAPTSVCPKGRTVAVGFQDGVIRILYRLQESWKRLATFKPHSKAVCVLEYSLDGKLLGSAGPDQIMFIMRVPASNATKTDHDPIGFVDLSSAVTSMSWRADSKAIMFTLADGHVGEVDLSGPDALSPDISTSFELKLPLRYFAFKRTQTNKAMTLHRASRGHGNAKSPSKEAQPPSVEQNASSEEAPDNSESLILQTARDNTSALQVLYKPNTPGRFLLTFSGQDAGTIYECAWDEAFPVKEYPVGSGPRAFEAEEDGGIRPSILSMRTSVSGELIITGTDDGATGVRLLNAPDFYTRAFHHDGDRGHVVSAVTSYDDTFLLSAGTDGLLIVYNLRKPQLIEEANVRTATAAAEIALERPLDPAYVFQGDDVEGSTQVEAGFQEHDSSTKAPADIDSSTVGGKEETADITDPSTYSIQDAKLKTEQDNRRKAAEVKKAEKRRIIAEMREELELLMEENKQLPPERQLDLSEFVLDKEYAIYLEEKGAAMQEEVRKECEFDSVVAKARLEKLRRHFLGEIEVEAIAIHGIRQGNAKISCFRTLKLSQEKKDALAKIHQCMNQESNALGNTSSSETRRGSLAGLEKGGSHGLSFDAHAEGENSNGEKLSTFQIRKKLRNERKQAMEALMKERPAADAADPRDLAAIAYAETHMGDYKLKSSSNYEVPGGQRMNAEKKMRQLLLLEERMHTVRMSFNQKVLALRDRKLEIIKDTQMANQRIRTIDEELGQPDSSKNLLDPQVVASEWPESRDCYSQEDLSLYTAQVKKVGLANARPPIVAVLPKDSEPLQRLSNAQAVKKAPQVTQVETAFLGLPVYQAAKRAEQITARPGNTSHSTSEKEDLAIRHRVLSLQLERNDLEKKSNLAITHFDESIHKLRRQKIVLEADLKAAEIKTLLYKQELVLLQNFEAKDAALALKMNKAQAEKADVVGAINECQTRLNAKKKEMEAWQTKDAALQKEFSELVPLSSPFHQVLLKIFKRKIKRAKKNEGNVGGGDDSDEDEDEDEEEEEDDEDFEEEDYDEDDEGQDDSCPSGCDRGVHEKVLVLRERRLDQEELLQELQKGMDELKRTSDRHVQRQKQIDKDVQQTSRELRAFQNEKQVALNQLDMVVPLTFKQIHCFTYDEVFERRGSKLVQDAVLGTHVLMSKGDLQKLDQRTKELEEDIKAEKQNFKALHREKNRLEKEKAAKEKEILAAEAHCQELQMLKFGQLIDLESLDHVSFDNTEKELKHKIEHIDQNNSREVRELNNKQEKLKQILLDATKRNTELLLEIADITARQHMFEKELAVGNTSVPVADTGPVVKMEIEERNRLLSLVELQAKELDVLKAEIHVLRHKGTSPPSAVLGAR